MTTAYDPRPDWAREERLIGDLASAVDALAVPDGGFTLDESLLPVGSGYAVSLRPDLTRVLASVSEGDLLEYLLSNGEVLEREGNAFGGWRDPADGRIYLDVSTIVSDREVAVQLAKDHDQLAVWSFSEGRSVPTY